MQSIEKSLIIDTSREKLDKIQNILYIEGVSYIILQPKVVKDSTKIVIFSHGTKSNIGDYYDIYENKIDELGVPFVIYDYFGFGNSSKEISEENCYDSLRIILKYFQQQYSKICLVGYSMGSAVTIRVASNEQENIYKIILLTPFLSFAKIFNINCISIFNIEKDYRKISIPIQLIASKKDQIVSYKHSLKVKNLIQNAIPPIILEDGNHYSKILLTSFLNLI